MKVDFVLVWCYVILVFAAIATSENKPSATFVAAEVPKVVWDLHFCESSFSYCSCKRGDRRSTFSWGFNPTGICKASTSESWVLDVNVRLKLKMLVWDPALDLLLNKLPTDANELAAAWFTLSCYEDSELIPCKLSPSEFEVRMILLRDGYPGVFFRGRFVSSVTIAK